jgi:hypothetical protein
MAQAISCWAVTLQAQVSPCGVCGGQSGTGTDFSSNSLEFPCEYHSTMALHAYVSHGG